MPALKSIAGAASRTLPHVIVSVIVIMVMIVIMRRETERNVKRHYDEVRRQENIRLFGVAEPDG